VGIGEGMGVRLRFGAVTRCVLRAGFVARARLTVAFRDWEARAFGWLLRALGPLDVGRRRALGFADRCAALLLSRFKPASCVAWSPGQPDRLTSLVDGENIAEGSCFWTLFFGAGPVSGDIPDA